MQAPSAASIPILSVTDAVPLRPNTLVPRQLELGGADAVATVFHGQMSSTQMSCGQPIFGCGKYGKNETLDTSLL